MFCLYLLFCEFYPENWCDFNFCYMIPLSTLKDDLAKVLCVCDVMYAELKYNETAGRYRELQTKYFAKDEFWVCRY